MNKIGEAGLAFLFAGASFVSASFAQSTGGQPQFEVASVKPSPADGGFGTMNGGPLPAGPFNTGEHNPERIRWTNTRLIRILMMAYDLPGDRISGPSWLRSEVYDVEATVPKGTSVADFKRMVQNLLAERFKLAAHRETKEVAGYALEVVPNTPARNTIRLRPSKGPANPPDVSATNPGSNLTNSLTIVDENGFPAPRPGNSVFLPGTGFSATIKVNDMYRATVLNMSMAGIAKFLEPAAGMPVEDRTGLTALYDFHLEYKPSLAVAAPNDSVAEPVTPGPDLLDAVQSQLGLKLVRAKVPREMLVIDRAGKVPAEN
ncbi:MAG TPA: TIGR03435 family protein [Bryobacteraceae bacterium]|nr:TIGR03435 family protein [Bryobacteraceae bacterium]